LSEKTAEVERLTEEVSHLQHQLSLTQKATSEDKVLETYHRDNERLTNENRRLQTRVRTLEKELEGMHAKSTMNDTSLADHPASQPSRENERLRSELKAREEEHKVEMETLKREKKELERRLSAVDWGRVEDDAVEIRTLKAQTTRLQQSHEAEVQELKAKLAWYAENMELTQHSASLLREQQSTIATLRARVVELEGAGDGKQGVSKTKAVLERERAQRDLARRVNELEEALRTRYPNSIPELIRACRPTEKDLEDTKSTHDRIKTLEARIISQGEEADAVIKALRVECDKMRVNYEARLKQKDDDTRLKMQALHTKRERELEKTATEMRQYYIKKIKELEGNLTAVRRQSGKRTPGTVSTGPVMRPSSAARPSTTTSPEPSQETTTTHTHHHPTTHVHATHAPSAPQTIHVVDPTMTARLEQAILDNDRLRAALHEIRAELDRMTNSAQQVPALQAEVQALTRKINGLQSCNDDRVEKARHLHHEQMWAARQEHSQQLAEMRSRWEADVANLKAQVQQASTLPQLASLDARGRVEYLQMVSQRLQMAEQHFAFRVSELQREAQEARSLATMELSVERQKMSLVVEQKNNEIERFRMQLDTMLHEIGSLRHNNSGGELSDTSYA
jgi:chromosome segregation ATPase